MAPEMPPSEPPHHYGGTIAPLIVRDMVVAGVAGADEGIRGFVAAFNAETGALVWRRWTVPRQGNQASKPGKGRSRSSSGSTWLTGSYDPSSDTLYWATRNPWPGGDDRNRPGDNLYTNCVLALNAATGEVKWHYQFTPTTSRTVTPPSPTCWWTVSIAASHPGCCSTPIAGWLPCSIDERRRAAGQALSPARGLGLGRRRRWTSDREGSARVSVDAANWSTTAFSPETGLYYFLALENAWASLPATPIRPGSAIFAP